MSPYEKAYIKWYWNVNKYRVLVCFFILSVVVILPSFVVSNYSYASSWSQDAEVMSVSIIICSYCFVAMAMILPILQFQFFMKKRSCDMYAHLPITRERFFWIQYGLGLVWMFLPIIPLSVTMCFYPGVFPYVGFILTYVLGLYLISVVVYSLNVCFTVRCNSIWDAIAVVIGINLSLLILSFALEALFYDVMYTTYVGPGYLSDLSLRTYQAFLHPLFVLDTLMDAVSAQFATIQLTSFVDAWRNVFAKISSQISVGYVVFLYWICILCISIFSARRTFCKRKLEYGEQRTSDWCVYPLMIFLLTTALLMQGMYGGFSVIFVLVVFVSLHFLAQHQVAFHKSMVFSFIGICLFVFCFTKLLTVTGIFGQLQEIPDSKDVVYYELNVYLENAETITWNNDGKTQSDTVLSYCFREIDRNLVEKDLDQILALQNSLVDAKGIGEDAYYGRLDFIFKEDQNYGSEKSRSYAITRKEQKQIALSFLRQLLESERYDLHYTCPNDDR